MWSRKSMWIHVVQFRKRGRDNLSSRTTLRLVSCPTRLSFQDPKNREIWHAMCYFATGQFTSWFTTITVFECRVWKSINYFFLNFWNLFILYHFYVVLRGNLGVFVSWRFSCTCKQLLQGAVCAQNMMLFITHLLHQHHLHHHLHLHKQSHHNRHCLKSLSSFFAKSWTNPRQILDKILDKCLVISCTQLRVTTLCNSQARQSKLPRQSLMTRFQLKVSVPNQKPNFKVVIEW